MKHLIVVMIALLIPAAAMAKGACGDDRQKFCKHAAHVGACLDQHMAELSEACKARREARNNWKKNAEESAVWMGVQMSVRKRKWLTKSSFQQVVDCGDN